MNSISVLLNMLCAESPGHSAAEVDGEPAAEILLGDDLPIQDQTARGQVQLLLCGLHGSIEGDQLEDQKDQKDLEVEVKRKSLKILFFYTIIRSRFTSDHVPLLSP